MSEGRVDAPSYASGSVAQWKNAQHPWVELFGIRINRVDLAGFLDAVDARIASRTPGYVVTPNVDHICNFVRDAALAEAYRQSMLVVPDSTPLMWAARLLGAPLAQKLSGSDLIYWLSEHAARRGYAVFLLGGDDGVADEASANLTRRFPGLKVAGTNSPPLGFECDEAALERIRETLQATQPDICFVAFGSPKQEIWMLRHSAGTGVPVVVGVGASFDFAAGRVRRAPRILQACGMEWAWRLCCEPKRLWRRYLVNDRRFFRLTLAEWRRRHGILRGDGKTSCSENTGS